jgi:hypothetical protein
VSPYNVSDGVTRTANPVMAAAMTEADLQAAILDLCERFGLLAFHSGDSRRDSCAGYPDLTIVGRHVVYLELKRQKGRVTPEQTTWLTRLTRAGLTARVAKPSDWLDGTVERLLRSIK